MPINYTEILDDSGLRALMERFTQERPPLVAMDFEGEFNLHCYGEKLCLIQIYDGKNFYLIDPFPITPQLLGEFLTMKNMVWLFYSGDSDASLIYKQFGVRMHSIYDVQHLVEVLDLPKKGLDAVLQNQLGVEIQGKKRYQRHNWTKRPIEEGAKQYALGDVAYLFDLLNSLMGQIKEEGKVEDLVLKVASSFTDFDKKRVPGVFKTRSYKSLSKPQKTRFQTIFDLREEAAKTLDVPAANVISKSTLFRLAEHPQEIHDYSFHHRIPKNIQQKLITEISALS